MGTVRDDRIVSDPKVVGGNPVIRGTRVTVELVLDKLGGGMTPDELQLAYPHLAREDILAALRFAADWLRLEDIEFAAPASA